MIAGRALDLVAALVVVALMRKGGFYPPDDLWVPGLAAAVVLGEVVRTRARGLGRWDLAAVLAGAAFCSWWWWRATTDGEWQLERQPVGAVVGFLACLVLGRGLGERDRAVLRTGALLVGSLVAVTGLVGMALHDQPLALPAEGRFRLATTLTYSNAAGAFLAMVCVVALTSRGRRLVEPQVVLVVGALVATQSRAALLALLVALPLVRQELRSHLRAVVLGLLVGGTAVAAGVEGAQARPGLVLGVVAIAVAAAAVPVRLPSLPRPVVVTACATAGAALVAGALAAGVGDAVRERLGTASVSDRALEWRAAGEAVAESPWTGAGPGLRYVLADGRTARFVHNEVLEVLADVGVVGLALLVVALIAAVRRRPSGTAAAGTAVLVVLLVCGSLDFPWHLPALTMTAGLLARGLAAEQPG